MSLVPNPFMPRLPARRLAHVALVLDRSGSMESCRDATIQGFNQYAEQIRRTADEERLDVRLTLTVFNHEIHLPLFGAPLRDLRPLDRQSYVPNGSTAMLDAVGRTIDDLERRGQGIDEASVLVCIISDGYENASREYSYADIAERIQRLTATDRWTFTYLGANQDLSRVSAQLNIPTGNTAPYAASPAGTQDAWDRQQQATARRMRDIAARAPATKDFYKE
jgi:hypothetical protein